MEETFIESLKTGTTAAYETFEKHTPHVIPAEAGIQNCLK
jgi:hypothetical protein